MDSLSKVRSRMSFTFFLAILCLVLLGPAAESAQAHRKFGFRGGFRGSFGRSFNRGRRSFSRGRSFSNRRFSSFRRFNYRGFRGFGRSRFNTLAFRGRRFSRGGFNRFNQFLGLSIARPPLWPTLTQRVRITLRQSDCPVTSRPERGGRI